MELKYFCKKLTPLVKGQPQEENDERHQIFVAEPCLGMDNHFSGSHVDKYLGENSHKAVMTRERGRLHKGLKKYMQHKVKVDIGPMSRAARFEQPVIAVKEVNFSQTSEKKSYMIVHIFFQSTGSTHITTINTLD